MGLSRRILPQHLPPKTRAALRLGGVVTRYRALATRNRLASQALQFPAVVQMLALLISNGLPITVAIQWLSPRLSGFWGQQFSRVAQNLNLGADTVEELTELSVRVQLPEVAELTEKLAVAIERGVPISDQLLGLANSLEASMYRSLTKRAGSNETKMLIPTIFLILPITVLFAVFPSVLLLQATY